MPFRCYTVLALVSVVPLHIRLFTLLRNRTCEACGWFTLTCINANLPVLTQSHSLPTAFAAAAAGALLLLSLLVAVVIRGSEKMSSRSAHSAIKWYAIA
jgi:hypothetical protein